MSSTRTAATRLAFGWSGLIGCWIQFHRPLSAAVGELERWARMRVHHFILATLMALVSGCASYNYNLVVKNAGTREVWCSLVASSKGMAHEPGRLVPGARSTIAGPFRVPYRDRWTVEWKTTSGDVVRKDIDLNQAFPTPFEGRLVFTVDDSQRLSYSTEAFTGR